MNKYYGSFVYGTALMIVTYIVAYFAGWVDLNKINYLEIFAVWTSFICTLFAVSNSSWQYPIGIITTGAYTVLFFQWNLPSVAWFNLYLVGSLCYGWYYWGTDSNPRSVITKITKNEIPIYFIVAGVIFSLLLIVNSIFGYETTYVDATVAILSGVAQWMLDRRKIFTWYVWAAVNVFSIYLYYNQGLYLVTLQYAYFLINAGIGLKFWQNSMNNSTQTLSEA